jgi:excisionase family DNA binding protein
MNQADIMAPVPDSTGSPLLRIEQAAEYLGVARSTFVQEVMPRIPQVRPTKGRVLFLRRDLDAFIEAQTLEPVP